ncbi:MAG: hypothetical protein ABL955_01570, partial [Elusimicrobiota bacterium]
MTLHALSVALAALAPSLQTLPTMLTTLAGVLELVGAALDPLRGFVLARVGKCVRLGVKLLGAFLHTLSFILKAFPLVFHALALLLTLLSLILQCV